MIGDNAAWDEFVTEHRWAVLTVLRADGGPNSSVVAYARDGDELVVSTPGSTFKSAAISRDPKVNLCVISNSEPFNFVAVEGHAEVTRDRLVAATEMVFANIEGTGYSQPEDLEGWLESQARVIIRIRPSRVYGVIR